MSYIYYNANPSGKHVGDCVIRAIATVLGDTWEAISSDLSMMELKMYDMSNSDTVWGEYLHLNGFVKSILPHPCPNCVTVKEFCQMFPHGRYVVATGSHVIAVIDGNYYDTSDTGNEILIYYWRRIE